MFEHFPNYSEIITALLTHYSFDLGDDSPEQVLSDWADKFEFYWIYLATVEALYQGRYKAISVEQILSIWQRRGKAIYHFNSEFEQLIRRNLPSDFWERFSDEIFPSESERPKLESVKRLTSEVEQLPPSEVTAIVPIPQYKPLVPRSLSKKSAIQPTIHTDFFLKLQMIIENSPKILPPVSSRLDDQQLEESQED